MYGKWILSQLSAGILGAASISAVADVNIDNVKLLPFKALPKTAPAPKDNPTTPAKVNLGARLYHDPRLSLDGTVSCASCHNVMLSGGDNRSVSVGVNGKKGGRSAPTVWNAAFYSVQFWDGRANTLEDQAKGPLTNPIEMAMPNHDAVIARVKAIPGYAAAFKAAFGAEDTINIDNVARAIAAYERTLITPSAFDKYLSGNKQALSAGAKRGLKAVMEVGCVTCHNGVLLNGPEMPIGSAVYQKFPTYADNDYVKKYDFLKDKGRGEVTKKDADNHMYRVPTLRNVGITAPYFHNGAVKTLEEAVKVMAKTQLNKDLSETQVADIVEFLGSLTGEQPKQSLPQLPTTSGFVVHVAE